MYGGAEARPLRYACLDTASSLPAPAGGTLFEPQITRAAAERRHAKWKTAVQRSFALAELTRDLEGDSEPRDAAEGGGGKGGSGVAAEPQGPAD